ncbi:formate dehydrogenase subunit beta, partial [Enterobacter hormaechei]|nr:formate dehydrogenase subunit beta [Enterobacter hormaechei]
GFAATFAASLFHYVGIGPNRVTEEDEENARRDTESSQKSANGEEQR